MIRPADLPELPDLYYIWAPHSGIRFMFDVEEGQRLMDVLARTTCAQDKSEPALVRGRTYTGAPVLLSIGNMVAFWLSTPQERAMDTAWSMRSKEYEE